MFGCGVWYTGGMDEKYVYELWLEGRVVATGFGSEDSARGMLEYYAAGTVVVEVVETRREV